MSSRQDDCFSPKNLLSLGEIQSQMYNASEEKLAIIYPESDGAPIPDNTLQFDWIVLIKSALESCFAQQEQVFVAGNLLWYPVEGKPKIRAAPDVLVALGRPKGYRGSYLQWLEGGIAPQVVFEILSPKNSKEEMRQKHGFYARYGVQEYYIYDPLNNILEGYRRQEEALAPIENIHHWTSPLLGIRFEWSSEEGLKLFKPDGEPSGATWRLLIQPKPRAWKLKGKSCALSRPSCGYVS